MNLVSSCFSIPLTRSVNPIAIITAVPLEATAVRRRLDRRTGDRCAIESVRDAPVRRGFVRGALAGVPVILACAGVGSRNARAGVAHLLALAQPRAVVSAGLAAGLSPGLSAMDVVVATELHVGLRRLPCWSPSLPGPARHGSILHTETVLITAEEKRLAAEGGALVADMESGALAEVACAAGVPFTAVRVVSDTVDEDLPLDFNRCRTADGNISSLKVILRLARRPTALPGLLRFARHCRGAALSLTEFLEGWLPAWASTLPPDQVDGVSKRTWT